ncbi:hypothetical protein TNCV_5129461 [Trichonephila clavipes]|nr:hypothetical protein TNCV_5129461 [Trichonephila clavipes]
MGPYEESCLRKRCRLRDEALVARIAVVAGEIRVLPEYKVRLTTPAAIIKRSSLISDEMNHFANQELILRSNMHDTGRRRLTRTINIKEIVLQSFEDNSNSNIRDIGQQLGVCQSAVWRIVHEQGVHPYHMQRVQLLEPKDYSKLQEFCTMVHAERYLRPQFSSFCPFYKRSIILSGRSFQCI